MNIVEIKDPNDPKFGSKIMGPRREQYAQQVEYHELTDEQYNTTGWAPYHADPAHPEDDPVLGQPIPGIAMTTEDSNITGSGEASCCIIFIMVGKNNGVNIAAAKHFNNESKQKRVEILNTMKAQFSDAVWFCLAIGGVSEDDQTIKENNKKMERAITQAELSSRTKFKIDDNELGEDGIYAWTDLQNFYWSKSA